MLQRNTLSLGAVVRVAIGISADEPHRSHRHCRHWTRLWVDASFLMADAAMVTTMRGWRLMAGGRSAAREAERIVGEKVEAGRACRRTRQRAGPDA